MNIIKLREYPSHLAKAGVSHDLIQSLKQCAVFVSDRTEPARDNEFAYGMQSLGTSEKGLQLPFNPICMAFSKFTDMPAIWFSSTKSGELRINRLCVDEQDQFLSNIVVSGITAVDGGKKTAAYLDTHEWIHINTGTVKRGNDPELADEQAGASIAAIVSLLFDIGNTANAVLSITPSRQGKSIHWHRARTHYCIINKSQAQKCQLGKRGPTDHELIRAAHWRRAHLRRLMSDKFKHKKGQLVFIKQSWVGPTEWIGTDKKIYKVVNTQQP